MEKTRFPFYSGNINLTKVLGHISVEQFVYSHRYPKNTTVDAINKVRAAKTPAEKRLAKQSLFSFTPSCYINKGDKRRYSNIQHYTGLMQVDLDGIESIDDALELKRWMYNQPECVCSYLSPSGNVKGLIRIEPPKTKEQYKRIFNAVAEKYEETSYFDHATKNAVLPLFLSMDPGILSRKFKEAKPWVKEKEIVIEYNELNDNPPTSNNFGGYEDYTQKTIRILSYKIKNISDNGHPQVRSAALILGSRIAAGYITKGEALSCINELIKYNSYLQKGVDGYLKTAVWGIEEGMKNPKFY